jgi:hypothetical protein
MVVSFALNLHIRASPQEAMGFLQIATESPEVPTMSRPKDFYDRPEMYSRAEPDDEYDNPRPEPLDPYFNDQKDITDEDDEDELDEDEV